MNLHYPPNRPGARTGVVSYSTEMDALAEWDGRGGPDVHDGWQPIRLRQPIDDAETRRAAAVSKARRHTRRVAPPHRFIGKDEWLKLESNTSEKRS